MQNDPRIWGQKTLGVSLSELGAPGGHRTGAEGAVGGTVYSRSTCTANKGCGPAHLKSRVLFLLHLQGPWRPGVGWAQLTQPVMLSVLAPSLPGTRPCRASDL